MTIRYRPLLALVGIYGLFVCARATRNIRQVTREAHDGDASSREHFTQTRYAHVLGPRNSDLGIAFYSGLSFAAVTGLIMKRPVLVVARAASSISLAVSAYLLWALLFRLRVRCPICLQGHAANVATFLLLTRLGRELSRHAA